MLSYCEENFPSRVDLGKKKYGGPFTEEGVENVKTLLMLLLLIIDMCFLGEEYLNTTLIIVFGIPFSHLILKHIISRYLHRISLPMLKLIGLGFVLYFNGCFGLSVKLLYHTIPSCGFYYYLAQSIILIFVLMLFIINQNGTS